MLIGTSKTINSLSMFARTCIAVDDADGTASVLLDPTGSGTCPMSHNNNFKPCESGLFPCEEDGNCPAPLGANTEQLIYVNPGGFGGKAEDALKEHAKMGTQAATDSLPTAKAIRWVLNNYDDYLLLGEDQRITFIET